MAFLSFEGLDGAGKTTLIQMLKNNLEERGHSCLISREPGGTPLGEELRTVLLRVGHATPHPRTEILLYEAIRAQHVEEKIRPALSQGQWVLCDRFVASSIAFQCGGRHLNSADIVWLNHFATSGLVPDQQILLDLPVDASRDRILRRASTTGVREDRFELEQSDFHHRVRHSFLNQAQAEPERWIVLDAVQPPVAMFQKLVRTLHERGLLT